MEFASVVCRTYQNLDRSLKLTYSSEMPASLDVITRKKLILVRQLYQRAVIQGEAQHSYVDRIIAVIGFDLSNETLLKAIVSCLDATKPIASDFKWHYSASGWAAGE
jgi:hypothetical protein